MFNDLDQNKGVTPQTTPVDDIFADTDKSSEEKKVSGYYNTSGAGLSQSEIEAQKIGLAASQGQAVSNKGKTLKIVLLVVLTILVISLGVVIYFKFIANRVTTESEELASSNQNKTQSTSQQTVPEVIEPTVSLENNIATTTNELTATSTTSTPVAVEILDTDGDGLSDEEEKILGTDFNLKDSDGDGLSDFEEIKTYNTNPNKVDSDGDSLSDYEEVMIYKTDPSNLDTDGDGYGDGQEVSGGYNPLGEGKLLSLED